RRRPRVMGVTRGTSARDDRATTARRAPRWRLWQGRGGRRASAPAPSRDPPEPVFTPIAVDNRPESVDIDRRMWTDRARRVGTTGRGTWRNRGLGEAREPDLSR